MFTKRFGEVLTDVMTTNPALADLADASSILDTSNYTFQAVTFGKDAEGFNHHGHTVYTSSVADDEVNLVIFAGQSNMNGIGADEGGRDLATRSLYNSPVSGIKYWDIETLSFTDVIEPGVNTTTRASSIDIGSIIPGQIDVYSDSDDKNFGPELNFARKLLEDEISNTYLFKFAHNGSTLVDLSAATDKWAQLGDAGLLAVLNNWNPGGAFAGNQYRLYNRFKAQCEAIISNLNAAGSTLKNVTFIWAQGEQEAFTGQDNFELAGQYSAACSYLIDEVSGIFSGASSFNAIRTKVNTAFASGTQGDYQYYPSGFYTSAGADPVIASAEVNALDLVWTAQVLASIQAGSFGVATAFPKASIGINPGSYGGISFNGTENLPTLRAQQEAMDTSVYGPLLSFDDLSGHLLDAGPPNELQGRIQKTGTIQEMPGFSAVSAYHEVGGLGAYTNYSPSLSAVIDKKSRNIHYNDFALNEAGSRFYEVWLGTQEPVRVSQGASSFNNDILVVKNYSEDQAPFASSYNISATYSEFSSTYNSVPRYPSVADDRLEIDSTKVDTVSSYQIYNSVPNLGHYANPAVSATTKFNQIWNVVGGFPPSGYEGAKYYIVSSNALESIDDLSSLNASDITVSGDLSGVFNSDLVMDRDGYLTVSPLSGLDEALSAIGTAVSGSAFSGGCLVFSSTGASPSEGITNLAIRLKDGDAAALSLFGGFQHLGVWCLDMRALLDEGLIPPFTWNAINNIRKYKLVYKTTLYDNLLYHKDSGSSDSGIEKLAQSGDVAGYTYDGPVFILKFDFK